MIAAGVGSGHFLWSEPHWAWLFLGMFLGFMLHEIIQIFKK